MYLSIPPDDTCWRITDISGADDDGGIVSAAGANCPASERNRFSDRINVKSWRCAEKEEWKEDPSITVTCNKHSKDLHCQLAQAEVKMANVKISGLVPPVVVIRSEGITAEWFGSRLGQYKLGG